MTRTRDVALKTLELDVLMGPNPVAFGEPTMAERAQLLYTANRLYRLAVTGADYGHQLRLNRAVLLRLRKDLDLALRNVDPVPLPRPP
jgi:hypothetical protein